MYSYISENRFFVRTPGMMTNGVDDQTVYMTTHRSSFQFSVEACNPAHVLLRERDGNYKFKISIGKCIAIIC